MDSSSCTATRSATSVDERPNRIGIDTGAYRTGVLTALGIEGRTDGLSTRHPFRLGTKRAGGGTKRLRIDFGRFGAYWNQAGDASLGLSRVDGEEAS